MNAHSSGWQRLATGPRDDAVRWWYFHAEDGGIRFARGGRVRRTRDARQQIKLAFDLMSREKRELAERPTHVLQGDGSLDEIEWPEAG